MVVVPLVGALSGPKRVKVDARRAGKVHSRTAERKAEAWARTMPVASPNDRK